MNQIRYLGYKILKFTTKDEQTEGRLETKYSENKWGATFLGDKYLRISKRNQWNSWSNGQIIKTH